MFQYAFGLAAAHRLGTQLAIDDGELRPIFALGPHVTPRTARPERIVSIPNDAYHSPGEILERLTDDTTYVGFFQSELFFSEVAADVRHAFRMLPEHVRTFRDRYSELAAAGYVCCHMRRTDYQSFAGGAELPMSYYESALAQLDVPPGMPIVFVGDDLEEARAAFGAVKGVRFEHNDEAIDLQLLREASAVVVSNSTFGWWGAWLNERGGKRVLAPQRWLGFNFGWEYPPRVIPSTWTQLRVRRSWRVLLSPARLRMSVGRARMAAMGRLRPG